MTERGLELSALLKQGAKGRLLPIRQRVRNGMIGVVAWLAATLNAVVAGHKQSVINDLLPLNYATDV